MAAVAQSAVTILGQWTEGTHTGKDVSRCCEAQVVLSSQGGATNSIGAALFGLGYIREVTCCVSDGNTWFEAKPSYDGSLLLMFNPAQATDASRVAAADVSDTIRVVVKGY